MCCVLCPNWAHFQVFEEIDIADEWFYDEEKRKLYLFYNGILDLGFDLDRLPHVRVSVPHRAAHAHAARRSLFC